MLFAHFTFFSFLSPTHLHADFGTCCYNASLICLCCRCLCCHSFNLASTPPLSHFIIYTTADNGDCYRTFFHSSLFQPNNYRKHAEVFTAKKALLALSPCLKMSHWPFLSLFIESWKLQNVHLLWNIHFVFIIAWITPVQSDLCISIFFALSIYFFVHPLCGRVAHFSRSIVTIICTFSDFFSR